MGSVTKALESALEQTPPPVWTKLGEMIVVALVVIAILVFLRSLISKPAATAAAAESERPIQLGEEHLPKGLTVQDYVNQWLEVRFDDLKKEFEAETEQKHIDTHVDTVIDESARKQTQEDQAKIDAIEAE